MAADRCCGCSKPDAPSVCSGCKGPRYCGAECQRRCWKVHKAYCQAADRAALWRRAVASQDRERILEAMRNLGPNFKVNASGATPLHDVAATTATLPPHEAYPLLSEVFEVQPTLTAQDVDGNTPLHLACRACHVPFIDVALGQALIDVDLSIKNGAGQTAEECLTEAAGQPGHQEAAQKFAELRPACVAYQAYRAAKRGQPLPALLRGMERVELAAGFGYIATEDLPPGTLLLQETALAVGSLETITAAVNEAETSVTQNLADLWPRGGDTASQVRANAYPLRVAGGPPFGLFLAAAAFNHSCAPNVFLDFVGQVVFARTCQAVRAGEELRVSYGPEPAYSLPLRRQALERYGFQCACPRCVADEARAAGAAPAQSLAAVLEQAIAARAIGNFEARLSSAAPADITPDLVQALEQYCAARMEASDMEEVLKGSRALCKLLAPHRLYSPLALPSALRLSSAYLMLQDEAGYVEAMAQATALCRTCLGGGQNMLFDRFPLDWGAS